MKTLALFSVLLFASTCHAQTASDGNHLLENCAESMKFSDGVKDANLAKANWCHGFLDGFTSAMTVHRYLVSNSPAEYQESSDLGIKFPDGVTNGQLIRVIVKWLRDNPSRLHEDESGLMFVILREAFPAKQQLAKVKQ